MFLLNALSTLVLNFFMVDVLLKNLALNIREVDSITLICVIMILCLYYIFVLCKELGYGSGIFEFSYKIPKIDMKTGFFPLETSVNSYF